MNVNIKQFHVYGNSANCYAISSGNDIALCDIGFATDEILEFVKANCSKIRYVLLTHTHYDHICGVQKVLSLCHAKLVVSREDEIGLTNPEYSLCTLSGNTQPSISADIIVNDKDTLLFGEGVITVLHTPGHTAGSVCYIAGNVMLSGDTLFCGSIGRTDFISGSMADMMNSLKKLSTLESNYSVYPGHGEKTELKYELDHNPYFDTAL